MKPIRYFLILLPVLLDSFAHAAIVTQKGSTTSFSYVESQTSLNPHALTPLISCTGAFKNIIVNGNSSDWNNIPILIDDPVGDYPSGPDIDWVKAANNQARVFFAEKFANPFPLDPYIYLLLDTDQNSTTGCQASGIGIEYGITINLKDPLSSYIGDARDCGWSDDFPNHGILKVVPSLNRELLEVSVPLTTLQILAPSLSSFDLATASNDPTPIGCYFLEEPEPPPCLKAPCLPTD
ncbi:hypothetical protein THII_2231 [Thioploca ingrica]|uniref:Secreted protein n=1 Tax=Thioploca ingrica TaxID=40754 RepID=A0A090AES9_9GAMM|nr:hypothetical protein THII_2231 [Thioploca ingrica]